MEKKKLFKPSTSGETEKLPAYEVPQVISYTDEEILELLGPVQANTSGGNL